MDTILWLLHGARMAWPTDWTAVFDRRAPLLMEIGFGGADFLVNLARTRPEANVIGVELSLPSLKKGAKKLETAGLVNGRVIQGTGQLVLWALCQPDSLSEVIINFPDPWPKERHHGRRLINAQFLHLLATRLEVGGQLDVATDHAGYAAWIARHLEQSPYFASRLASPYIHADPDRLITKYEQKGFDEGRSGYYFKWQRNDTPAPNPFPIPKELSMPHVILNSPLSLEEIGRRFTPQSTKGANVHVELLEAYQSAHDGKLLVEAYIKEEPLTQRVGLVIRRRELGDLVVGLHEVGFPRPTPGVQVAVASLARWVVGLDPASEIVRSNVSV
ncbi:MAG: tRNA (guanosine(46)-N7)-methyltransferase TrmB, partial [Anaerolineales bacterium]|nr:tRNA (guanosine(46)-N7)-methyltransferase TrmB [Anaerolineales bacterium]